MHKDNSEPESPPRGPRGGNSGMSIPPGVELDSNYATDDWPMPAPEDVVEPESEPDD
ncbi:MAG TPA: hypothetical protein VHZ97_00520 [Pseudonocardiaceae bacterium]|jgi:hypothetical protein|nr:hypothetical protein [Pseudonocardiaceae bacterium]